MADTNRIIGRNGWKSHQITPTVSCSRTLFVPLYGLGAAAVSAGIGWIAMSLYEGILILRLTRKERAV